MAKRRKTTGNSGFRRKKEVGEAAVEAGLKTSQAAGGTISGQPTDGPGLSPSWLTTSPVYRRVPVSVRTKLDADILLRPPDCQSIRSIYGRHELKERYGVSFHALRTYADRLERFVRPAMTSQVMAGVLGCLPARYRRQLVAGSEVMLVSRVVQALSDEGSAGALSVADLARLAAVLEKLAVRGKPSGARKSRRDSRNVLTGDTSIHDATQLAQAVRAIYGLSWPADKAQKTTEPVKNA